MRVCMRHFQVVTLTRPSDLPRTICSRSRNRYSNDYNTSVPGLLTFTYLRTAGRGYQVRPFRLARLYPRNVRLVKPLED